MCDQEKSVLSTFIVEEVVAGGASHPIDFAWPSRQLCMLTGGRFQVWSAVAANEIEIVLKLQKQDAFALKHSPRI
jgi:hypothetical protein